MSCISAILMDLHLKDAYIITLLNINMYNFELVDSIFHYTLSNRTSQNSMTTVHDEVLPSTNVKFKSSLCSGKPYNPHSASIQVWKS